MVRRDWQLEYDVDDVLRGQAADPAVARARRPLLVKYAERALANGRGLIEPAVLSRRLRVEGVRHERLLLEDGHRLSGPLAVEHLAAAEYVIFMLCTVGHALGRAAIQESSTSLAYALALDSVGSAAVTALGTAACDAIHTEAVAAGLETTLPLSPGMEGMPVDPGQREIFAMIDSSEVGVVLTPSLGMIPTKSVTMVLGVGEKVATPGGPCDYCALRDTCRQRISWARPSASR
jgi:hypothetical protein